MYLFISMPLALCHLDKLAFMQVDFPFWSQLFCLMCIFNLPLCFLHFPDWLQATLSEEGEPVSYKRRVWANKYSELAHVVDTSMNAAFPNKTRTTYECIKFVPLRLCDTRELSISFFSLVDIYPCDRLNVTVYMSELNPTPPHKTRFIFWKSSITTDPKISCFPIGVRAFVPNWSSHPQLTGLESETCPRE